MREVKRVMEKWEERNNEEKEEMLEFDPEAGGQLVRGGSRH